MFEELFAPLPDAGKYLERMGLGPIAKPDRETLDRIVLAHLRTVPFENLDVYDADEDILLDPVSLYGKIVTRRRGGYCFELNAALTALLRALGYDCYAVASRVVWFGDDGHAPLTHQGIVVTIDGTRYFCDVGFGGPMPYGAVLLDSREEQQTGPDVYKVIEKGEDLLLGRVLPDRFEATLRFSPKPVDPVDFLALNEYQSRSKNSWFRKQRLLNLGTEGGSLSITGNVLKIHDKGEVTEVTLKNEEEIKKAMREWFGIVVDFPLKRDWEEEK